jgi:hypothetical protein
MAAALNIMLTENTTRVHYDLSTAVTFLASGLALGWVLALLFSPVTKGASRSRPTPKPKPLPITDEV